MVKNSLPSRKKETNGKKKIGIPRGLGYYHYPGLFETFFKELGAEVIISKPSSRKILLEGLKYASDEECFSCKIFLGHVKDLVSKVDYLFIPKFQGAHKSNVNCPKFIGLPDVIKVIFDDLPELIAPYHSRTKKKHRIIHLFMISYKVGLKFTKNPFRIVKAMKKALSVYKQNEREICWTEEKLHTWEEGNHQEKQIEKVKIALLGHAYVLRDPILSFDIQKKLKELNVELITSEEMPNTIIDEQLTKLHSILYFIEERRIVGTALYFLESETVDGILQLIPFPCGPTAVSSEIIMRYAKQIENIPLIQLMVDDNTGEAGFMTRLEAFIMTLKRKKFLAYRKELHENGNVIEIASNSNNNFISQNNFSIKEEGGK